MRGITGIRAFSDVSKAAKARQLLSNAFERMQKEGYRKSAEQLSEVVESAKQLNISPDVARQAYQSAKPAGSKTQREPVTEVAKKKATVQTNIEMFGEARNSQYESADFQYDDLPALAHLHLEEHRDARQFIRAAAYELPLLTQYRSEYRRADVTGADNLRFKHYAFPREESNPASSKVVLTFTPESTGLTGPQLHKLKLLAGPRLDQDRNEIRFSSNQFGTQAQNKRWLGHTYSRLIAAAKEDAESFADIPLDPRPTLRRRAHAKSIYPEHKWPKEWNRPDMAPKRREDIFSVLETTELPARV